MDIQCTWAEYKQAQTTYEFNICYFAQPDYYNIWGTDGIVNFVHKMQRLETAPDGSDQKDFEDNFINNPAVELNKKTYGRPLVQSTARPEGTTSYFTCSGDNGGIGNGNQLIFNMSASDVSKSVDITFNEGVWFKDGLVWADDDAPFGSYIDIEIVHPTYGVVGSFGRKLFLIPNWAQEMNTEDRGYIQQGLMIRITVYNSNGLNGKDPAGAFKVIGRLEIYRETQV